MDTMVPCKLIKTHIIDTKTETFHLHHHDILKLIIIISQDIKKIQTAKVLGKKSCTC